MLLKDQRFENYMVKYSREKVKEEMDKLISSFRLRKQATNIYPENFETFLYVDVDREHQRHTSFTRALLHKCVDSSNAIMADLDAMSNDNIPLRDNMTEPLPLKDWTNSQCNFALVAVVALLMLCYIRSERFNIVQRVNTQFAFANNVPKQFVELFHQMDTLVLYESLCHGLQANVKAVMEAILEKT